MSKHLETSRLNYELEFHSGRRSILNPSISDENITDCRKNTVLEKHRASSSSRLKMQVFGLELELEFSTGRSDSHTLTLTL